MDGGLVQAQTVERHASKRGNVCKIEIEGQVESLDLQTIDRGEIRDVHVCQVAMHWCLGLSRVNLSEIASRRDYEYEQDSGV